MSIHRFNAFREAGVLGINGRNATYIFGHNPRKLFPLVDDKLTTKKLCDNAGIRTPELYGTIFAHHELRELQNLLKKHDSFVIKPSHGAMGNGVLVITGRTGGKFVRASGQVLNIRDLRYYISSILSGLYSLGQRSDSALIESRVVPHSVFRDISTGVPDCRIIVFRGVPVMSMLRLPTKMSDGRANLHQGAIAAGINIKTGMTHHAIHLDRVISKHPDTGKAVHGIQIPCWDEILKISAMSADITGLGYLGVDIVIDEKEGPLLLELNARPGLSIQIANGLGLIPLLKQVEKLDLYGKTPMERASLSKTIFFKETVS